MEDPEEGSAIVEQEEKEVVFEPDPGMGLYMSKNEIINRQFDLTERAVRALEHIAAKDEARDKAMELMQRTINQNSQALTSNTSAFKVLETAITADSQYLKPVMKVVLYLFIVFSFAILILAGLEQAIKLPINLPGF